MRMHIDIGSSQPGDIEFDSMRSIAVVVGDIERSLVNCDVSDYERLTTDEHHQLWDAIETVRILCTRAAR